VVFIFLITRTHVHGQWPFRRKKKLMTGGYIDEGGAPLVKKGELIMWHVFLHVKINLFKICDELILS